MSNVVCATATQADQPTAAAKNRLFGVQISAELDAQLAESAKRYNLTKSGIARLALERGLVVLNEQLGTENPKP